MSEPDFWNNQDQAQAIIGETKALKAQVDEFQNLNQGYEDLETTYELLKEEFDEELAVECETEMKKLIESLNTFELELLLNDPYDKNNAILELHPGAGGTESQDWASMLLRMIRIMPF